MDKRGGSILDNISGKRGSTIIWVLVFLIIIVTVIAVYFTFIFAYTCNDITCFKSHQEKCVKTDFINDVPDTTWRYHINGKEEGKCEIEVEIVRIKDGTLDKKRLEGKSMTCLIPLGSTISPESDTTKCSGELKEELQSLIIQKLHQYILDNLGEIDEGLTGTDIGEFQNEDSSF
jgi:hypothetical protein